MVKTFPIMVVLLFFLLQKNLGLVFKISLFHDYLVSSLVFACQEGEYELLTDDSSVLRVEKQIFYITSYSDNLLVLSHSQHLVVCRRIRLISKQQGSVFRIKPVQPVLPSREYEGDLEIISLHNQLRIINMIGLDVYLAGVIETEAGPNEVIEYYKSQAVISRTYAIKNYRKHIQEGFNLCDDVHCQSYRGRNFWNDLIPIAIKETKDLILVSRDSIPIIAAYHANSGGETQAANDIWLNELSYLRSRKDPYSLGQSKENWEESIHPDKWKEYLEKKGFNLDNDINPQVFEINSGHRQQYYVLFNDSIPFVTLREDWDFRSSYFSILYVDNKLLFRGRGYGHGVGLSQEGAMNMAKQGFTYREILQYYYDDVLLSDYNPLRDAGLIELESGHLKGN